MTSYNDSILHNNATSYDATRPIIPGNETQTNSLQKPSCYTTVAWRMILSPDQNLAIGVSYSFCILPTVILNAALCFALYKTKQLGKTSKFLVFLLSFSDCLSGLISVPGSVILFTLYGNTRNCWYERGLMFFGQTNGHFSLYIIMTLAIQKYFNVRPTFNKGNSCFEGLLESKRGLNVVVLICFGWSIFHGLVSVYFFGYVTSTIPNKILMVLRSVIVIVIYIFYFRLYFSIKRYLKKKDKSKSMQDVSATTSLNNQREKVKKLYNGFFRTIYFVLIAFAVSYVPVISMDTWTGYYTLFKKTAAPNLPRFLYFLSHSTLFFNCAVNAFLFLRRDEAVSKFYSKLFFGKSKRSDIELLHRVNGNNPA